jgi:hypothetical protein
MTEDDVNMGIWQSGVVVCAVFQASFGRVEWWFVRSSRPPANEGIRDIRDGIRGEGQGTSERGRVVRGEG